MNTDEILNEIKDNNEDIEFLKGLEGKLSIFDYMKELLTKKGETLSAIIPHLGYDRCYAYQFFSGKRNPTRTLLLRLSVLLALSVEETQRLLNVGERNILYARVKRDAAIIFALEHKFGKEKTDKLLEEIGERPLFT